MKREIEFNDVRLCADELNKGFWQTIKVMIDSMSDEEIEKIPSILGDNHARKAAERYGICDVIDRNGKWINIYWLGGYLMKGETNFHTLDI